MVAVVFAELSRVVMWARARLAQRAAHAGVDKSFPKGTIYPGVIALYRALTEAKHYRKMHRITSRQQLFNGNGNGSISSRGGVIPASELSTAMEEVRTLCTWLCFVHVDSLLYASLKGQTSHSRSGIVPVTS